MLVASLGCESLPTQVSGGQPPARGVTFVDWTADGYATPAAAASLDALAATGANTLIVIVTAYQRDARANQVRSDDPRTPSRPAVGQVVVDAALRGMQIVLKPHVDLDDGRWRGTLSPADPAAWFDSYREYLVGWARYADSLSISEFVVGTELAGTIEHEGEWRETIAAVRQVFSGRLVYAASWDEAARVPFWDALDLVGVNFYFPVTTRRNPGRLEILGGWAPWLERLRVLGEQTGLPVLLTEIGYRSIDGAGIAPHDQRSTAPLDLVEQADLYWAAFAAIQDRDWIAGLYWWNWPADGSGGPTNADYTPAGKPAAAELASAWRGSQ
ncbi:MAG TPA: hypothetical protein VEY91_05110 [Candidatus Limnocylindria bacterium]|nr:hypothetical protein [Candidatus Limnocylindria bacterium]